MEKKINNILLITAEDGTQMTFRVLFTYHSDRFGKDHAVFYNEADENHLLAYAFDDCSTLHAIESAEEGAEVEAALAAFDAQQSSNT
jgi:uncharacterized protein YrzB (UPF0473 family)